MYSVFFVTCLVTISTITFYNLNEISLPYHFKTDHLYRYTSTIKANEKKIREETIKVIRLFCAAGMSTSLLVKKMEEAAKEKGKDVDIVAYPFTEMERVIEGVDVALLGPQVGYQLARAKEICDPKGVPVDVIPMQDYGMCNGMNVLKFAYKLAKNK